MISPYSYPGIKKRDYKDLLPEICKFHSVEHSPKNRKRQHTICRQWYSFISYKLLKNSTTIQIGRELGGFDHSTVIHNINTVTNDLLNENYKREFTKFLSQYDSSLLTKLNKL